MNDASLPTSEEKEGCRLCIITLQCGIQLISKHIKIRPDLSSCQTFPATRIDVKLADPLQYLISSLPEIEKLPYFTSITDANIELFQQLRVEMISTTDTLKQADLDKIAAPLVHKMQLLKPSLVDKLESYVPIKLCLTLTITVFIGNLLHILVMYLYHKIRFFQRITPNFMKFSDGKIPLKPVVLVANSELTKILSLDLKMKNLMTIVGETNIDNNIDARLLKIEAEIQYLDNEICVLKTITDHKVDICATTQKPHLPIRRSKSTISMRSNPVIPNFFSNLITTLWKLTKTRQRLKGGSLLISLSFYFIKKIISKFFNKLG